MLQRLVLALVLASACGEDETPLEPASGGTGAAGHAGASANGGAVSGAAGKAGGGGRAGRGAVGGSGNAGTASGGAPAAGRGGSPTAGSNAGGTTPVGGEAGQGQGGTSPSAGGAGGEAAGDAGASGSGGAPPTHSLGVTLEGTGSGTVTSSPAGLSCSATCSATFDEGEIRLSASAALGSAFAGWIGCDAVSGKDCLVELGSDKTVTASFDECGTIAASDDHYVDVQHGTDDEAYGSGPRGCAYKSIAYAREHALGVIRVAAGTYDTAEVFPIVLAGAQSLVCTGSTSVIRMTPSSGTILVHMLGDANTIKNCSFDMGSFSGSAIDVQTSGTHLVENVHFIGGGSGATVGALVGSAAFVDCTFTGGSYGIYWENASYGTMSGNTFSSNSSGSVRCQTVNNANVTGSNNTLESCVTCSGCPFD